MPDPPARGPRSLQIPSETRVPKSLILMTPASLSHARPPCQRAPNHATPIGDASSKKLDFDDPSVTFACPTPPARGPRSLQIPSETRVPKSLILMTPPSLSHARPPRQRAPKPANPIGDASSKKLDFDDPSVTFACPTPLPEGPEACKSHRRHEFQKACF